MALGREANDYPSCQHVVLIALVEYNRRAAQVRQHSRQTGCRAATGMGSEAAQKGWRHLIQDIGQAAAIDSATWPGSLARATLCMEAGVDRPGGYPQTRDAAQMKHIYTCPLWLAPKYLAPFFFLPSPPSPRNRWRSIHRSYLHVISVYCGVRPSWGPRWSCPLWETELDIARWN